ncbi:MAG: CDC27 family protein [Spirochaetia bacterium]|nr:tetratricopeptide repeat protein [Spirochaetota bacterium]MCX8096173.1 tetratricopeptide repeat protein [Spirochaetota bacterium]MDW8113015.1 CDC27 family protein [Spirochaetia bacterium]
MVVVLLILFFIMTFDVFGSYESAYSKYLKGDISGAVSEITKDIFNGVRDPRSHLLMIKIYRDHTKDYKQAIEYAIEGIRLFPDKEREFTLELGELYMLSAKYDRAEQILVSHNRRYPGDPECLYILGRNYYSQGKYHKAVSSLEASLSFGMTGVEVYEVLGKSYRKIGNYSRAIELLSYVYNQTRKEEILGMIIEISSIIDVDYSSYINARKTISTVKPTTPRITQSRPSSVYVTQGIQENSQSQISRQPVLEKPNTSETQPVQNSGGEESINQSQNNTISE